MQHPAVEQDQKPGTATVSATGHREAEEDDYSGEEDNALADENRVSCASLDGIPSLPVTEITTPFRSHRMPRARNISFCLHSSDQARHLGKSPLLPAAAAYFLSAPHYSLLCT